MTEKLGYQGTMTVEYEFHILEDTINMREGYTREDIKYYIVELWYVALSHFEVAKGIEVAEGIELYFGRTDTTDGGCDHVAATDDDLADVVGSCRVKVREVSSMPTWEDRRYV